MVGVFGSGPASDREKSFMQTFGLFETTHSTSAASGPSPSLTPRAPGVIDSGLGRVAAKVEDAQGTPTQSHTSPSILLYED